MAIRHTLLPLIAAVTALLVIFTSGGEAAAESAAAGTIGTTSANFLGMGVGARASALGGAFVAVADDATAGYWNPAGLPQVIGTEIIFMHNNWYQDISSDFLGAVFPVSQSVALGVDISYVDYGSFDGYDGEDRPTGEYSANAYVVSSSGAVRLSRRLSVGLTGKVLSERLDRSSAIGYAADFGALYSASVFSFGVNLKNIGEGLKYEADRCPLPRQLVLGLAVRAYDDRLRLASDIDLADDRSITIHQGIEYCYENTVFVRTGCSHDLSRVTADGSTAITMGFGIRHSVGAVDYSYWPGDRLGDIHRISFRLNFGGAH